MRVRRARMIAPCRIARRWRSPAWLGLLVGALVLCTSGSVSAQASTDLDAFLDALAREVPRFRSADSAIAHGYRKLGPDFPGMGEHWIHPGLVIAGSLDPGRPPVIAYTQVEGERRLVGFAFTRVLDGDEHPPEGPFPPGAWHDHTGGVDEESLLLSGPASMHPNRTGHRLAMVHLWIPVENPDGILSQNNWTLPFHRVGLPVPEAVSSEAARTLSLGGAGMRFYEELLREGIELEGTELRATLEVFEAKARAAREWIEARRGASGVDASDLAELEALWGALWDAVEARVDPSTFERMSVLRRDGVDG